MEIVQILVIGRHPEIMKTIIRLINNNPEWNGNGVFNYADAISFFNGEQCNLVLLGAGVPPEEQEQLQLHFSSTKPHIPVVQHYGGGSGLLAAEIYHALSQ